MESLSDDRQNSDELTKGTPGNLSSDKAKAIMDSYAWRDEFFKENASRWEEHVKKIQAAEKTVEKPTDTGNSYYDMPDFKSWRNDVFLNSVMKERANKFEHTQTILTHNNIGTEKQDNSQCQPLVLPMDD